MLSQRLLMLLMVGIILPISAGYLISDAFGQCTLCNTQPGEQGFLWLVRVTDPAPFETEYTLKDVNGVIVHQGIMQHQTGFVTTPPASAGIQPFNGYEIVNPLTNLGPYTVSIRTIDPDGDNWVPKSAFCFNAGQGGGVGTVQPDGTTIIVPFVDRQIVQCHWSLIKAPLPDLIPDTIIDNLVEIVEELEDKDQKIQDLLDKQLGHDDAINELLNFKITIDDDKIKFKELELTVDQMIASLQLILQELQAL